MRKRKELRTRVLALVLTISMVAGLVVSAFAYI